MVTFFKKIFLYFSILIFSISLSIIINNLIIRGFDLAKINLSNNILVIGASRTESSVNDKVLANSFNISGAGDPLFYTNIKLRTYKKYNEQIDTVFLSMDSRTLDAAVADHFYRPSSMKAKLPRFFHFLSLGDWKKLYEIDLKSSVYASAFAPEYSARLVKEILSKPKSKRSLKIGGYKIESRRITQEMVLRFKATDTIQSYKLSDLECQNLKDITKFCKANKITLIFVNPPLHPEMYHSAKYQQGKIIFEEFLKKEFPEYTYLNFSGQFLPDSCYADLIHLNKYGAEIFSKKLDSVLKNKN